MSERDCVFCDRKNFEERIIGETESFYIIATLGQITDGGYTLLVPKRHVSCVGEMEISEIQEMTVETNRLSAYLYKEWSYHLTIFEHGIVGQSAKHAHLHFVPALCYLITTVRTDFPDSEIIIIESLNDIKSLYSKRREPYLFWRDGGNKSRICLNPPAPPQYFRKIIAYQLGCPERANWCDVDPEFDKKLWSETVIRLKKYF